MSLRSFLLLFVPLLGFAQDPFARLEFRPIGPAIMGGRVTDVEGVPGDPNTVYVATGTGGLWKTVNGGVSWTPIFDRQTTTSIGDIALDPRNPEVIWVGAGESNTRNSVSFGDGVYKSTDGGKTWQHMGLKGTDRISRVLVHPFNPDVVYVGALGHVYGPHPDRGVYMTTDGGATWRKTLYLDDRHGVADLDIDPANPNILFAAMWLFERKPWTHTSGSEQGGLFRSADGGRTWKKITAGLPKLMGRLGVKAAPSNPKVVYVAAESKEGTLFRSADGGETFTTVNRTREIVSRGFYYADLRVDPVDENRVYALATNLFVSIDGGRDFRRISGKTHSDYHALWIDPKDPQRIWQGQDGGIGVSYDRGETWEAVLNIPLAQYYQLHADNRQPFYHLMGGLQDNGTWAGPSRTREPAGILNDDWRLVSFGDGFHVVNHPDEPELYLTESQGGYLLRADARTREQQAVSPQPKSNAGGTAADMKYRFNWNTPIVPSPHDKNTVYFGGNVLFQSSDFGKTWKAISPDLTHNDREKQKSAGGPVWYDNSTAENHGTIISVMESPVRRGTIWAGTDDGRLQRTVNGGESWTGVTGNIPGLAPFSPVSHVEASRTTADTAYVAFDRHMFDDYRPYLYKTVDGGRTWTSIAGGLPENAYLHVVREDPRNAQLLYAGSEVGLFVSFNGGAAWERLTMKNLPHVPVHEILVHPRERDLIIATHGRSLYIFDDSTPLQQLTDTVRGSKAHLFDIRPPLRFATRFTRYGIGSKAFTGPNPPYGALITYWLKEKGPVQVEVLDAQGKVLRELKEPPGEAGLNRVAWDLRLAPPVVRREPRPEETEFSGPPRGPQVLPGIYTVRLTAGGEKIEKRVEVKLDPTLSVQRAELAEQHDYALKLNTMYSKVNEALKSLDALKDRMESARRIAAAHQGKAPASLESTVKEAVAEIDRVAGRLGVHPDAPRLETPPALADNLRGLFSMIEGVNAAPTQPQKDLFVELEAQYKERMAEANRLLSGPAVKWLEALRGHEKPAPLAVP